MRVSGCFFRLISSTFLQLKGNRQSTDGDLLPTPLGGSLHTLSPFLLPLPRALHWYSYHISFSYAFCCLHIVLCPFPLQLLSLHSLLSLQEAQLSSFPSLRPLCWEKPSGQGAERGKGPDQEKLRHKSYFPPIFERHS